MDNTAFTEINETCILYQTFLSEIPYEPGLVSNMLLKNILIKGDRSAGKSHLIGRIIEEYSPGKKLAGFITEKKDSGLVSLRAWDNFEFLDTGDSLTVFDTKDGRVRKDAFETLGVWSIERAQKLADLMIFDELGRFEQDCPGFINAVHEALDHEKPVFAALKNEENPFLKSIVERDDIVLFNLRVENRDRIRTEVISILDGALD